jgi:hypothetical protein
MSGDSAEKHWLDGGLRNELLRVLKRHDPKPGCVRIAAHMETCFGPGGDEWQVRFIDEEASLEKDSEINDIQVWGFHHDKRSPIWQALNQLDLAIQGDTPIQKIHELEHKLERAFRSEWDIAMGHQIEGILHDVLSDFPTFGWSIRAADASSETDLHNELPAGLARQLALLLMKSVATLDEGLRKLKETDAEWLVPREARLVELRVMLAEGPAFEAGRDAYQVYADWQGAVADHCDILMGKNGGL